jgi:hypothetical protein
MKAELTIAGAQVGSLLRPVCRRDVLHLSALVTQMAATVDLLRSTTVRLFWRTECALGLLRWGLRLAADEPAPSVGLRPGRRTMSFPTSDPNGVRSDQSGTTVTPHAWRVLCEEATSKRMLLNPEDVGAVHAAIRPGAGADLQTGSLTDLPPEQGRAPSSAASVQRSADMTVCRGRRTWWHGRRRLGFDLVSERLPLAAAGTTPHPGQRHRRSASSSVTALGDRGLRATLQRSAPRTIGAGRNGRCLPCPRRSRVAWRPLRRSGRASTFAPGV